MVDIFTSPPVNLQNGDVADATEVMANFNQIISQGNAGCAKLGVNNDITQLLGLTTPLSPSQGGSAVFVGGTSTGSANAQAVAALVPNSFALVNGNIFTFIAGFTNTAAATLALNSTAAKSMVIQANGSVVPLVGGEIQAGQPYMGQYIAPNYVIFNPSPPITILFGLNSTPPAGRLTLNGDTIAKTSGATFNGTQYANLYTHLWNLCSSPSSNAVCPVAGGLGANAAADFAANKALTLLTMADVSPYGVGSLISQPGAKAGATTVTPTGSVTINGFTISIAQLAPHTHPLSFYSNIPASTAQIAASSNAFDQTGATGSTGSGSTINPTGSITINAANIVHPVIGLYGYINF